MAFLLFNFGQRLKSHFTTTTSSLRPAKASPDELLGELFQDVQLRRIYPDGMTFVDLVPANKLKRILRDYARQREHPRFNLHKFVHDHFKGFLDDPNEYKTDRNQTIEEHITDLWTILTREVYTNKGSLMALPHPYVVPGGRFIAEFYWDSYFTMLGLAASGRYDLIEGMIKNFAFLIRKFGYIPSANRTYYVGRSQPPFFAYMVELLAQKQGKATYVKYLPYLLAEYRFWMKGHRQLHELAPAYRRVVMLSGGELLNRYYDNKRTPRPESYKEDVETAYRASERIASQVYLDIRAAAESGWDFSSRWFRDGKQLTTIHTADFITVDLNCLLYKLETTLADTYALLKQPLLAKPYRRKAAQRAAAINKYCWSEEHKFFVDYDFVAKTKSSQLTLAGIFPLYIGIASQEQAAEVADQLKRKFLKEGGLLTTLVDTGQQWDAPNGWAALHWITIQGLRRYGFNTLADDIKKRWCETNVAMYKAEGKLVEKYNVAQVGSPAGGGEYALQDGFSMTNGVFVALAHEAELDIALL